MLAPPEASLEPRRGCARARSNRHDHDRARDHGRDLPQSHDCDWSVACGRDCGCDCDCARIRRFHGSLRSWQRCVNARGHGHCYGYGHARDPHDRGS